MQKINDLHMVFLTKESLDRVVHSLTYHFGLTDNEDEDEKNTDVIRDINKQLDAITLVEQIDLLGIDRQALIAQLQKF
jgi:hypothetical protein